MQKSQIKKNLLRTALPGFSAGLLAALSVAFFRAFLPSPSFGLLPVLLGLLPGLAHLLFALKPVLPIPDTFLRPATAAAAILLPPALVAAHYLTGCSAYISAEPSALNFILLAALAFLGFGLPIAVIGDLRIRTAAAPPSIAAAAAGFTLLQLAVSALDARLAYAFCLPFLAAPLFMGGWRGREPEPPKPAAGPQRTGHAPGARGDHRVNTPPANAWMRRALALFVAALTLWCLAAFRLLALEGLDTPSLITWIIPAAAAAFALGVPVRALIVRRFPAFPATTAAAFLAATAAAVAYWLHETEYFSSLYVAYYAGTSLAAIHAQLAILLVVLPAFFAGIAAAPLLPPAIRDGGAWRYALLPAAVAAGTLAFVFAFDAPLRIVAAILAGAAVLTAVAAFIPPPEFRARVILPASIPPVLSIILLVTLFTAHVERFPNLFDPIRFRVASTQQMPAGEAAFLQSRDDDDPNYVTMWNRTHVVTQSLNHARPVLFRFGHIPMLLHPDPRRVLLVGLGSRMTAEAVAMHAPERITCVEPTAAFIQLRDTMAIIYSPDTIITKIRFHAERPAAFFAHNTEKHDLIISAEPFAAPDIGPTVFSEDYFRAVARSLDEGGILAQWLPLASMPEASVKSVIAAITAVFPETEAWICGMDPENAMLGIIASMKPLPPADAGRARFDALRLQRPMEHHLATIGLNAWEALVPDYAMDRGALLAYASGASALSDFAPAARLRGDKPDASPAVRTLLGARTPIPARLMAGLSDSLRKHAVDQFNARPLVFAAAAATLAGDDEKAATTLFDVLRDHPWQYETRVLLAEILTRRAATLISGEKFADAIVVCNQILRIVPINTGVLRLMMIASQKLNDPETVKLCVTGIRALRANSTAYQDNRASVLAQSGKAEDAILLFQSAITLNPLREETYCNEASLEYSMGRKWEAMHTLDQAVKTAYYPARAYYVQGLINLDARRPQLALDSFRNFLRTATPNDPHREEVLEGINKIRATGVK